MREHKCIQNENANGSFKAVGEAAKSHNADIPVLANMKAAALLIANEEIQTGSGGGSRREMWSAELKML